MVSATCPRFSPLAARIEAAPSVGPTHGLHTPPEHQPKRKLAPKTARTESAEPLVDPIADRTSDEGELRLELRHEQHETDGDEQHRRNGAEHVGVETYGKADRRDE